MTINMNSLSSMIAKLEGKKSQTSIGNIREQLKILKKLIKSKKHGREIVRYLLK